MPVADGVTEISLGISVTVSAPALALYVIEYCGLLVTTATTKSFV